MNGPKQNDSHTDNTALACSLGGLITVVFIFHLAAGLATRLSGHGSLGTSMSQDLEALVRLPTHMATPASAWTGVASLCLPGPAMFWGVQLTTFALFGCAGWFAWTQINKRLGSSRSALGVASHGGMAQKRDLGALRIRRCQPGRLTLGRLRGKLIATEAQTSLAVIGPSGCGKTAGFAIPALLEWSGPVIATSVKADLIEATINHRRKLGKVWVYDPTRCSGQLPSPWTPLSACNSWPGAMQVASWLCEAAQPRLDTVSDGDYWYTQARKALAPYLFAAATSGRSMADVVCWIDTQGQLGVTAALRASARLDHEVNNVFGSPQGNRARTQKRVEIEGSVIETMREYLDSRGGDLRCYADQPISQWPAVLCSWLSERLNTAVDVAVRADIEQHLLESPTMGDRLTPLISAQSLWNKDQRLRDSVFATVENVLAGYADPSVANSGVARSDLDCAGLDSEIDFDEWLSGDNTIYVVATSHEQARLRPVLTVLVQQAIRRAYDCAMANGGALSQPCLVLLDEAGNTAPLRDLPAYASTARSHAISLVTIWQDLAQIKAIYRDRAQTVLNNHRAKLFGTGIADDHTLEYISRLIGEVPQTERNFSRDLGGSRRSVSEHTAYRSAAPIDVVRRIAVNEAVLVYGSELPAHIRLRPWFADNELRARAGSTDEMNSK